MKEVLHPIKTGIRINSGKTDESNKELGAAF